MADSRSTTRTRKPRRAQPATPAPRSGRRTASTRADGAASGSRRRSRAGAAATIEARTDGPDLFRYWKPALGAVLVLLAVLWVGHMEGVAARQRLQRELRENPRTAAWFREQKILVDNGAGPDAIWHGRIKRLVEGRSPLGGDDRRLMALELGEPTLLGGDAAGSDDDLVYIRVDGHRFAHRTPAENQRWVISVVRDAENNNVIYASVPAGP